MHILGIVFFAVLAILLVKAIYETVIGGFQLITGIGMWILGTVIVWIGRSISAASKLWRTLTTKKSSNKKTNLR
jgi:hypothetical protein